MEMSFRAGNRDIAIPWPITNAYYLLLGLKNKSVPQFSGRGRGTPAMLELLLCTQIIAWTFSVLLAKTNGCFQAPVRVPSSVKSA